MSMTSNMFESIKSALEATESKPSGLYGEILKTPPENTFVVKLLPFAADPSKTFFHYFMHGWESFATGSYMSALSPTTFGERDPISEARFKAIKGSDPTLKEVFEKVRRSEKWLINVLVIDDPVNPDNNGTVKILRYGKQLGKIIDDAISGEDSDEFGTRVFEMDGKGVVLKIKVDKQGDFPNYTSSRFAASSLKHTEKEMKEIFDQCHELDTVFPVETYDELVTKMNEHILCNTIETSTDAADTAVNSVISSVADAVNEKVPEEAPRKKQESIDTAEIDDLLDGLDL